MARGRASLEPREEKGAHEPGAVPLSGTSVRQAEQMLCWSATVMATRKGRAEAGACYPRLPTLHIVEGVEQHSGAGHNATCPAVTNGGGRAKMRRPPEMLLARQVYAGPSTASPNRNTTGPADDAAP